MNESGLAELTNTSRSVCVTLTINIAFVELEIDVSKDLTVIKVIFNVKFASRSPFC